MKSAVTQQLDKIVKQLKTIVRRLRDLPQKSDRRVAEVAELKNARQVEGGLDEFRFRALDRGPNPLSIDQRAGLNSTVLIDQMGRVIARISDAVSFVAGVSDGRPKRILGAGAIAAPFSRQSQKAEQVVI
ncbi:MAG: hypothetical protein P4L81_06120 [Candidatus Pacebacteria bacterium]|nr:hypothetical protein [Candidatus Paceibacterota bacterium]